MAGNPILSTHSALTNDFWALLLIVIRYGIINSCANEKKFSCVCGKAFSTNKNLARHIRFSLHCQSSDGPGIVESFPCPNSQCRKVFKRLDNLDRYLRDIVIATLTHSKEFA